MLSQNTPTDTPTRRYGVLTRKVGMTRLFEEDGRHCPVSLLKLVATRVLDVREDKQLLEENRQRPQRDKKHSGEKTAAKFNVLIAAGEQKKKRLTKPMQGVFAKAQCPPMRKIVGFRVFEDYLPTKGAEITTAHFSEGQFVDVSAISIGKGFAGAMKRHGFKGLRATHGVSVSHRSMGSTGNREFPGKVFKGKKMPGRMGAKRVTIQNLKVVALDQERNLILVKGAVPGARGGWVIVNDAIKKRLPAGVAKPAGIKADIKDDSTSDSPKGDDAAQTQAQTQTQTGESNETLAQEQEASVRATDSTDSVGGAEKS